jgi:hypothetical protein
LVSFDYRFWAYVVSESTVGACVAGHDLVCVNVVDGEEDEVVVDEDVESVVWATNKLNDHGVVHDSARANKSTAESPNRLSVAFNSSASCALVAATIRG